MHCPIQRDIILCFRLASKVKEEPLKSDFTIDLKHEVSVRVTSKRSRFCVFQSKVEAESRQA